MKLSICISVYQSHGVFARQVKYWNSLDLPDGVEFIIADDESHPPLEAGDTRVPITIFRTGNTLAWTQGIGRNMAAERAKGDYFFFTDIDHILSPEAIQAALEFGGDRLAFPRFFAILTEDGVLTQDLGILREYGLDVDHLNPKRGLYGSFHLNTFVIKRSTFEELGGYTPEFSLVGYHPESRHGDDCHFNHKWNRWAQAHDLQQAIGPRIYLWPTGRFHIRGETNPFGLFHDLSHEAGTKHYKGEEREGATDE